MTTSYTTSMRRRQNIRLVLFLIILATLPFYCVGFALWGFAPQNNGRTPTPSSTVRATVTALATRTPIGQFPTSGVFPTSGPLVNTPGQFIPPVLPTFSNFPTATFVIPPSATMAPSLTFQVFPTATVPPAASSTPIPFPTETPFVVPDTDGDGVPDNLDPCPNDPYPGTGCPPATAAPTSDPGVLPSETPLPFGS